MFLVFAAAKAMGRDMRVHFKVRDFSLLYEYEFYAVPLLVQIFFLCKY